MIEIFDGRAAWCYKTEDWFLPVTNDGSWNAMSPCFALWCIRNWHLIASSLSNLVLNCFLSLSHTRTKCESSSSQPFFHLAVDYMCTYEWSRWNRTTRRIIAWINDNSFFSKCSVLCGSMFSCRWLSWALSRVVVSAILEGTSALHACRYPWAKLEKMVAAAKKKKL